ncbi:hypothetical protein HRR83_004345 [Exophiala dermatitidis]|uniref:Uncharacterized protein n=1 Tax=Exophiala dermatitidis TaxID=5970 RepID=A0AAN6IUB7_EXODE|nr:hypothetical protein HRR73_006191 [Exophiala dermatitidis]KAJ4521349.1 hypothetical protein HRR74_003172 [Exophiala dermatitidis]KAJ4542019.1 hypothetical protein HRR77_005908 [Exophiala dermatitidis]KAJ4544784.1 hypothetical protein HRR76_002825 [Exophiala dermatitidis]KAJ4565261.1 hypothetical protein HRR79_005527 [Exophiala dermatitidis]
MIYEVKVVVVVAYSGMNLSILFSTSSSSSASPQFATVLLLERNDTPLPQEANNLSCLQQHRPPPSRSGQRPGLPLTDHPPCRQHSSLFLSQRLAGCVHAFTTTLSAYI